MYIKTWIGIPTPQPSYESAGLPRGGGWGSVRNILLAHFDIRGADSGASITQENGRIVNSTQPGSSLMEVSNVQFVNFTGWLEGGEGTGSVSCATAHPCFNIDYQNVSLSLNQSSAPLSTGRCTLSQEGGVTGLSGEGCD